MKKDVVAGIGEIGRPILKLLSKSNIAVGFDLNHDLMDERKIASPEGKTIEGAMMRSWLGRIKRKSI